MSYANLPYSPLSLAVWRDKYQFGNETSPEDTLRRVATAFEVDGVNFLEETITAHKFVPGGRILAGLNTTRKVTFSQCYVIPSPEDSMEGILHTLGEYVLTLKAGGGVGFNCSTLRPKGTDIATNPGAVASGPLSFAQIFDAASKTIVSGGCLVGDTLLTTQTGWVSIKDVVTKKMAVKVRTHAGFRRITDWFDNGEAETIKVTFEGGQAITCTQAHKFHTLNEKGELVKKPIGEFSVGDTCLFSTLATSPLSETPDDISYLLGYYWANGYDQYRTLKSSGGLELHSCTITMPNTDYGLKIREQIQATLNDYAVDYRIRSGCGDCTIIYLPKKSAAWLTSWHGAKGKSAAIEFPHGVSVVPFIAGFFDGDGSWRSTKAGAKFSSTSKGMLATIQLYLMDLGVPSKLSVDYRTNGWRDLWTLSILGQEWQGRFTAIFGDWIHKLGPITVQGKSFNYPPEALYFESPVHKDWAGSIVEGQRIGHATFKRLWPDSELLAFGGIRIIDIEPAGRQHVYDIEVEGTHSYTVGGISVSNSRRGASMLVMDVSHPDIEEFIAIKQTPGVLTQFNISVAITDEFMKAVAAGEGWDLIFNGKRVRTVPARDLWNKIMQATYEYAEPGVLFIDRINKLDPLGAVDKINATNPCGEQALPPYASCNLGAINLVPFVPFDDAALEDLRIRTMDAVDFLDSVLDVNYYPLEAQRERAMFDRRIGIGIMGLGSALAIMGIDYGSPEAVTLLETILRDMQFAAQVQTVHLAKTKGPCPAYLKYKDYYTQRRQQFLTTGQGVSTSLQELLTNMEAHGVRNSHLLTIAPTGNTSIFAKNVSGGIEPVFAPKHNRTVLQPDGTKQTFEVVDASLELGATEEYFSRNKATALSVDAHLAMLATAQKFIDNSVSKTINVAADCDFESFKGVYTKAYSLGCKGCTTYRPSEVRGAVLTEPVKPAEIKPAHQPAITSRPRVLDGKTYKIRWDGAAYYVTINDLTPGRPFEFFINSKNKEDLPWITGLTRLASAILRKEGNPNLLITEFKEVYGVGGEWEGGTFYSTIINKLGAILEEHVGVKIEIPSYSKCPKCGSHEIVHSEGCISCTACGYSKCS